MHPYDPLIDWSAIGAKLHSAFGDPNSLWHGDRPRPGKYAWMPVFDRAFSNADFIAARHARVGSPPAALWPAWYVEFHVAGYNACESSDVMWAQTQDEALAYLHRACHEVSFFPDSVHVAETTISTSLSNRPFATVGAMRPRPRTIGTPTHRRAQSTLRGLAKSEAPYEQLLHRLRRWPGMGRLEGGETSDRHRRVPHVPDPGEWLHQAHGLLSRGGLPTDHATCQRLVACVLDANSFNSAIAGRSDEMSAIAGPWIVKRSYPDGSKKVLGFFVDAFDGLAGLIGHFEETFPGGGGTYLEVESTLMLHSLSIRIRDTPAWSTECTRLSLEQLRCTCVERGDASFEAVAAARREESGELMKELFGVGLDGQDRIAQSLAERGYSLIGRQGRHHFVLWRKQENEEYVGCIRFDDEGNAADESFAHRYKGSLAYVPAVGCWALFSDYDEREPVAVFSEIARDLARRINEYLPEHEDQDVQHLSRRTEEQLRALLDRARAQPQWE